MGPQGVATALLFALVGERLSAYYEHGQWLKDAPAATLANSWLARSGKTLPAATVRQLAAGSDQLARQIEAGLSRQAGLFVAHEMMEALDPNYRSELAETLMAQCRDWVQGLDLLE